MQPPTSATTVSVAISQGGEVFSDGSVNMVIAYLTTDEVNQTLALQIAERCGVQLFPLEPREAPPNGEFDAVLYDLDYLPQREAILNRLRSESFACKAAVHSYNLTEAEVKDLRANGVKVYRRLQPEVFLQFHPGR
jgi:hypothetical protein